MGQSLGTQPIQPEDCRRCPGIDAAVQRFVALVAFNPLQFPITSHHLDDLLLGGKSAKIVLVILGEMAIVRRRYAVFVFLQTQMGV